MAEVHRSVKVAKVMVVEGDLKYGPSIVPELIDLDK